MPKVLHILNRFNLGGPTVVTAYTTKYLDNDFTSLMVGGEIDETEESSKFILDNLGIDYVVIPEMKRKVSLKEDFEAYRKIKALIQEFKPDIVHTHASKAGALGRLAAKKCKVPVVVHTFHGHVFHSYFGKVKTFFYKSIEQYLARQTDKIIAISHLQKEELSEIHKIAPIEKFEVIKLGIDLIRFRENKDQKRIDFRKTYGLTDNIIAIGIIGRLVPIKNHGLFLKAIKYLNEKSNQQVVGVIVGDGEENQNLKSISKRLGLNYDSIYKPGVQLIYTSWVKEIDVVNNGLDIICLTSLNEGTPVSLIEAQAANKPIVTTNIGGIKDIVLINETAFVTDVRDEQDFFDALIALTNNKELRDIMSKKGWDFAKNEFSYERVAKETSTFYRRLLTKKNA